MLIEQQQVLDFWFTELEAKQWWKKDPQLDNAISQRFKTLHQQASQGELWQWRETAEGSLAEIIILDQFSRNIYRNQAQAFAFDGMALLLAQVAIAKEFDTLLTNTQCSFLYMPFMHSESKTIHEIAVTLYDKPDLENNLEFEIVHKDIIDKYGRYPHRNVILGRTSTPDEIEFLKQPNSSF